MDRADEKIQTFTQVVMKEAVQKKERIVKEALAKKSRIIEKKEIEYLTNAYKIIQTEIRKINKQKNESVSKALIKNKQTCCMARNEVVDEVFEMVYEKIEAFKKTESYKEYLLNGIKETIASVGQDGHVEISVDEEDVVLAEQIKKEHSFDVTIIQSDSDIVGGVIGYNKTSGLLINKSIKDALEYEKEHFLEFCSLEIE